MGDIWERYPLVFHYTSQAALVSILRSQSLHATHYRFLNDSQEVSELLPEIINMVRPHMAQALERLAKDNPEARKAIYAPSLEDTAQHEAQAIAQALYKATYENGGSAGIYEPFIVSFCGHVDEYQRQHGQLSQWRSYGRDGGFAIAFDTKRLVDMTRVEIDKHAYLGGHLSDVVYADQQTRIADEFSELTGELKKFASELYSHRFPKSESLVGPFLSCTSRFKHRGFKEENEVRIVVHPVFKWLRSYFESEEPENFKKIRDKALKEIHFRENLAPYLIISPTEREKLPIKYVIVGPDARRQERADKLKKVLQFLDLSIPIVVSEVPLV